MGRLYLGDERAAFLDQDLFHEFNASRCCLLGGMELENT
jgi:hypothetical protein